MWKNLLIALTLFTFTFPVFAKKPKDIGLLEIGTYKHGKFDSSAAEIVAYDPASKSLFMVNADEKTVDILDITDPANPMDSGKIDVSIKIPDAGGVNSVALHNGLVAIAVEHDDKQEKGWTAFYDIEGNYLNHVQAGELPDAVAFTPDGKYVLTANEGEPSDDYSNDPEGSVSIIDLNNGVMDATVKTADFHKFNGNLPEGVRAPRPFGATVAQDLEPEFIAISPKSNKAWVTLQENNALAIVDIKKAEVTKLIGLGNKNHNIEGNGLDASNKDDSIKIQPWPVKGTYMPDGIAAFKTRGRTYLITANEGDGRDYRYDANEVDCTAAGHTYDVDDEECIAFTDEVRVKDVELDSTAFPNAHDLQKNDQLGRLKMLSTEGGPDADGEYKEIHSFGGRSFSIWNTQGKLVFDSGDAIEQRTARLHPDNFNSTNDENDSFDDRSDDKGPEPEGVVVGKYRGRQYAFVGLERIGGVMIFDVTNPSKTRYVSYTNNRDFNAATEDAGDLGPEGILFIKPEDSPNKKALLVVGNEVSGTTTIYQVTP